MRDELETAMQLCGITSLSEATPNLLNTAYLVQRIQQSPSLEVSKAKIISAKL